MKAKPHTIALRLTDEEYRGLQYYMRMSGHGTWAEALRDLLPLDQLASKAKKADND